LICQHEPILTMGKSQSRSEALHFQKKATERGWQFSLEERGGGVSIFLPGMLMIYPVISLKRAEVGVKSFVSKMLGALTSSCRQLGLEANYELGSTCSPDSGPGVWVGDQKIGSAGFRIRKGVSDYGLSLNVSAKSEDLEGFLPCGLPASRYSSMEEIAGGALDSATILDKLQAEIFNWK